MNDAVVGNWIRKAESDLKIGQDATPPKPLCSGGTTHVGYPLQQPEILILPLWKTLRRSWPICGRCARRMRSRCMPATQTERASGLRGTPHF